MQWVMYVSCSLSRNLDGELTALVQRSCCWDGGRNLLDTMRSVEVGFLKIGKSLYVGSIVRVMSKQVRLLPWNMEIDVKLGWIVLNCSNVFYMLEEL